MTTSIEIRLTGILVKSDNP